MKNAVILELAARWEKDAIDPEVCDGSEDARIPNAKASGAREQLRACADTLKMLVQIIG